MDQIQDQSRSLEEDKVKKEEKDVEIKEEEISPDQSNKD